MAPFFTLQLECRVSESFFYCFLLCIPASRWKRKLFPNHLISVLYPQVCREPHLPQGHPQLQQHRPPVVRRHMANLVKVIYRMGQAPQLRCKGMCWVSLQSVWFESGLGMYEALWCFFFLSFTFFLLLPLTCLSSFNYFLLHLFILYEWMICVCIHGMGCMWRFRGQLVGIVLSFQYVGSGDQTQAFSWQQISLPTEPCCQPCVLFSRLQVLLMSSPIMNAR